MVNNSKDWFCRRILVLLSMVVLASCAQTNQIGYSVNLCCPGDYDRYAAYGIELHEMPGFLSDYVVAEFDAAMLEKGLIRNDRINDMSVKLSYRHVNLNPEQETIDPFERRVEEDVVLRYVAIIAVEMVDNESRAVVWAGQINRIHSVLPGEYMHENRARPEFRNAFRAMLQSYPSRSLE